MSTTEANTPANTSASATPVDSSDIQVALKPVSAQAMAVRTALILLVFVVLFSGLLAGAYLWTKPAVDASAAQEKMKLINEILPSELYNNALLDDVLLLPATPALGLDAESKAYRARKDGKPVAAVLEAVAPDGYAGKIRLILAFGADERLIGVRVTQHKETPGLGDYVDPKKDKDKTHPWIMQFNGRELRSEQEKDWRVKKDGGSFDYHAGATITPRAVVKAVAKAMKYARDNREALFAPSPVAKEAKP